ncbi:methyl-accepting chemotaxis protein [Halalkalibacter sp. APA_J-10(15)]|uniref:methyl-accepting chemotaxis protein n=1 Tax=Halalkalibacter sp. APA_J-10(15) TaxID=2933805 RepID=UPI001FF3E05C|nr:methyl-accepting chemotaxis protein [Halalkalibacter sp. APA_J-10(15)]MCK0472313.1 methyl-accepting chemotaxis protein [Halalkalibacter sp. APA_J-10(15)]
MKRLKQTLTAKINILVLSIILILSTIIGGVIYFSVTDGIEDFAIEKARGDLALSYRYIDTKYPGEWEIRDGQLYKGVTSLEENFEIVDEIGADTGNTVTIFREDTRVATNVVIDGERAVGTKASDEVAKVVLEQGEYYFGEANVVGQTYQTAYMPLYNSQSEPVGIYYVGASQETINVILTEVLIKFIIVLVIIVLLAITCTMVFTRRLKSRLSHLSSSLEAAGDGDFTSTVSDATGDELTSLATSFNKMTANLKEMMEEVKQTSEHLASSSEQLTASAEQTGKATETITESIQHVASGAESSTASIEEGANTLTEVNKGVQNIAENATLISEATLVASEKAESGESYVNETVRQMEKISESVAESGHVIQMLDKRSKEIGDITQVISDISEQTNLLALNAAIEAARAGEHGKGFAVVADEVRKLAEQSQQSTSEITSLISTIQKDMEQSTQSIDHVFIDVQGGMKIAQETEGSFKEILEQLEKVSGQVDSMAATAEEISASSDEVTSTISTVAKKAEETASHSQNVAASAEEQLASMEEVSSSAQALSSLADDLQALVKKFKVD